jgi:hypothetical protein
MMSRYSIANASLTLWRPLEKRRAGMHVDWGTLDQRLVPLVRILLGRVTEESLSKALKYQSQNKTVGGTMTY